MFSDANLLCVRIISYIPLSSWLHLIAHLTAFPQTFLLKLVSHNSDGSTSVVKSMPCEAGSSEEICMIEVSALLLESQFHVYMYRGERCSYRCRSHFGHGLHGQVRNGAHLPVGL